MENKLKIAALILLSLFIIASLVACGGTQSSLPTNTQPVARSTNLPNAQYQRGANPTSQAGGIGTITQPTNILPNNQANTVSGDGTTTVATYANLYFGTAGQIETLSVNQGDHVTKGTVLAKLDTTSLEPALAQATVAMDQAKLAQTQANTNLQTAQFNLDKVQAVSNIEDAITTLQQQIITSRVASQVNMAQAQASSNSASTSYEKNIAVYQRMLATLLSTAEYSGANALTYNVMGQTYDRLTVEDARSKELAVELAQQTLNQSQDAIDLAQKNLNLAQEQLDQATIIAPFDGIVASVNQDEGDIIPAPAQSQHPIIYLIDPSTMEINIQVNELDMANVSLNQKASISIDAFPDAKLEGQVTVISPVPTVQGGIADYTVTITFSVPANIGVRVGMNGTATIAIQ
jgi:HlyD family secretion protein